MKNRLLKTKLLTALLVLCMMLALVPITAFAADPTVIETVNFTHEDPRYKFGDTPRTLARITDSNANYRIYDEYLQEMVLVEEREGEPDIVAPTGRYWHSNPLESARLADDKKITKLEPGADISYWYFVVFEPVSSSYKFTEDTKVYRDSLNLKTPKLTPHLKLVDMSIRLQYSYWATVSVTGGSEEQTITDVSVVNVNTNLDAATPVTFTARADTSCADKFDITEEAWEAASPLNDTIKSTDAAPHAPKAGGEYWYSVVLTAKDGYVFSKDFSDENCMIKEGSGVTFTVDGVSYTGALSVSSDGKTLTAWEFMYPVTVTEGDFNIKAVSLSGLSNNLTPNADFTFAAIDENSNYTIESQYWYSDGQPETRITPESADKKPDARRYYTFTITLAAKGDYVFPEYHPNNHDYKGKLYVNGEEVIDFLTGTVEKVSSDGKKLTITLYKNTEVIVGTIDSVAVIDAILSYHVGDAPKAAARVAAGDGTEQHYRIQYENWDKRVNGISVARWYSDENQYYDGCVRFEAFEEGQQYEYFIVLKADQGWIFEPDSMHVLPNTTLNGNKVFNIVPVGNKTVTLFTLEEMTPTQPVEQTEIELVEINNATVSFKDGDAPVFTGTTPGGAKYSIVYEAWKTDDAGISSDAAFNDAAHLPLWGGRLIDTFDKSKTYTYMLYLRTTDEAGAAGWVFGPNTRLRINGKEVAFTRDSSDAEYGQTFTVSTNLTMTPQPSGDTPDYKIIEGANGVWTQNSDGTLTFRANGDFSKFTGVKVDGRTISPDYYTASSGSTVVTLKHEYLATLSIGKHKLTVVYSDGECGTYFEIKAKNPPAHGGDTTPAGDANTGKAKSPATGDASHIVLGLAVLLVGGGAAVGATVAGKKKRNNR